VVVGVEIDGTVHQRCFSLAGSPHRADGTLELTVKANPAGRVSRHLVDHAQRGAVLRLSPARGDFTLPGTEDRRDHLVFLSGGSGITPVLSMLRTLADERHDGPVTFVHYADRLDDVCYLDELRRLTAELPQGRLLLGLADGGPASDLDGFFGADHLDEITDDPSSCQVFLCGPAPMMASVEELFSSLGLEDRVRLERFGLPPMDPSLADAGAVVGFERSGVRAAAAGTVLETAEAAGLAPAFGCRRGICGTCTTTKTSGVVRNAVTGVGSAPDAEPIRLCVSVPVAEVVVDL
jgi:ferredoxin-NADP reductase